MAKNFNFEEIQTFVTLARFGSFNKRSQLFREMKKFYPEFTDEDLRDLARVCFENQKEDEL